MMYPMDTEQSPFAREFVSRFLDGVSLPSGGDGPCPYLPDQTACSEGFATSGPMDGAVYLALLDRGFRRSGQVFYRPVCESCRQCIPLRVPIQSFRRTRSQRRVWRRNADVSVRFGEGLPGDEKHALFARYLNAQHDGTMSSECEAFEGFLYDSPVPGAEICYHVGNRLVGVSLVDVLPGALSSVYMLFDPAEAKRSLGTFSVLWEIEHCRSQGIAYYYLGYYVPGSKTMAYKARFEPAETLDSSGRWVPLVRAEVD